MAAGLMRQSVGDRVHVDSAGTRPGANLNELSVRAMREIDVDITGQTPKPVTPDLVGAADLVVILGREARLDPVEGARFEVWETDEPSERGIEGEDRMRLVRDDIAARVRELAHDLGLAKIT